MGFLPGAIGKDFYWCFKLSQSFIGIEIQDRQQKFQLRKELKLLIFVLQRISRKVRITELSLLEK